MSFYRTANLFSMALVFVATSVGCLPRDVPHRPPLSGHVRDLDGGALGGVTVRACTTFDGSLSQTCDVATDVTTDGAGRYTVPVHYERVWLILNATPRIGSSLIWVCGTDDAVGGAQVLGHDEPRTIDITLGSRGSCTLSPVEGFVPTGEQAERICQAIRARCSG